ncbi:MAG TPA: hypothetical protein VG826_25990 [Pirellulales bacterium]|nr:hypothetical protein [Pirellulales bacterium]
MENEEAPINADRFRAILGGIREQIQRRESPGKSVAGELLAERRDEAGHD